MIGLVKPEFLNLPKSDVSSGYRSGSYRPPVPVSSSVNVKDDKRDLRQFLARVALNAQLGLSKISRMYLVPPIREDGHSNYHQVGRDKVTRRSGNYRCGSFSCFHVCDDVEGHEGVIFNGEDCSKKVVVLPQVHSCNDRGCVVCHMRGYGTRLALAMKAKLDAAVDVYGGRVEALVISPPERLRDKSKNEIMAMAQAILVRTGVFAGVNVFHGRRYDRRRKDLYWSPHLHGFCLISGGFDICRECSNYDVSRDAMITVSECRGCKAYMGRVLRECEPDGWIIKVLKPRKAPDYGASYVLSHCTFDASVRRDMVVRYFGACANKRLKSKPVELHIKCPACGGEVKRKVFNYACKGRDKIVTDVANPLFKSVVLMDEFDDAGRSYFLDKSGSADEGGG